MTEEKSVVFDMVLRTLAGAIGLALAYIVSTAGGSPPIDMKLMIYLVAIAIASVLIWGIGVQQKTKSMDGRIGELMKSQQLLMRYRLLTDAREYIQQGFIAREDLELWLQMYDSYEKLGKNGVMTNYYHQIRRLPTTCPIWRKEFTEGKNVQDMA